MTLASVFGAVILGNLFTMMMIYGFWLLRNERDENGNPDPGSGPWLGYAAILFPLGLGILAFWSGTT